LEVDGRRRNHNGSSAQPAHRGTATSNRRNHRGRGQRTGGPGPAYRRRTTA
jgi:hypothetical protein